jgi:hypothetical protein
MHLRFELSSFSLAGAALVKDGALLGNRNRYLPRRLDRLPGGNDRS